MPRTIILSALLLGLTQASSAQPPVTNGGAAADARQGTESRIEAAVAVGSEEQLREILEGIGDPDPNDLSQTYLAAYTEWRIAQMLREERNRERKKILKRAQKRLEQLVHQHPANAEALALLGSVIGDRIEGGMGGMFLGPKANRRLQEAHELAPDNPRVALLRGIGFYFTPKTFGGGLEKATEELHRSRNLFLKVPEDSPWPNWGRLDALAWLGIMLGDAGRTAEARSAFEEALRREPNHRWIRDELLPKLALP